MDWNDEKMGSCACDKGAASDKDFSVKGMLATAYSPKLRAVMAVAWVNMLIFIAIAVWSVAAFIKTEEVKTMILAATGFTMSMIFVGVVKLFVCQNILLANLKRDMRRMEQKIDDYAEAAK